MASKINDMTSGRPAPLLMKLALPLMAGNIFQQLYTVVDTAIVGQALGVSALAAIGDTDWFTWMILSMIEGLTQGFGILIAQSFGAGEKERMHKTIGNSITLSAISAVIVLILSLLMARPVLTLLKTPESIMPIAMTYVLIRFAGIPIMAAYNMAAALLRSLGDGRTPLYAMIIASLVNISLDTLLVIIIPLGVAGAAVATLIAQLISTLFCFWQIRKARMIKLSGDDFRPDPHMDYELLYMGAPMAIQFILISVGGMILQAIVNEYGVLFIAGFTATNRLYGIMETAAIAYGFATATYMGQNLGAGRYDRIRKGMRTALIICMITSILVGAAMIIFGKPVLSLFISGTPEETRQTMYYAYLFLVIMSSLMPMLYLVHLFRNAVEGLGNSLMPMMSGVAEFIMRVGAALTLPGIFGMTSIFFAEPLAWLGSDVILIFAYFRIRKKLNRQEAEL